MRKKYTHEALAVLILI